MILLTGHHFEECLGELIVKIFPRVLTKVAIILFSPALGALFAPLALKFVQRDPQFFFFFSFLTGTFS